MIEYKVIESIGLWIIVGPGFRAHADYKRCGHFCLSSGRGRGTCCACDPDGHLCRICRVGEES